MDTYAQESWKKKVLQAWARKMELKLTFKAAAHFDFNILVCWFIPTCTYLALQLIQELKCPNRSFLSIQDSLVFVQTVRPCPWDFERLNTVVWVACNSRIQNVSSFVLNGELQRTVAGKESICCHSVWIKPFIIWLLCSTEPRMRRRLLWHFAAHPRKQHVLWFSAQLGWKKLPQSAYFLNHDFLSLQSTFLRGTAKDTNLKASLQ